MVVYSRMAGVVEDQFPAHQGNVVSGGEMARRRQAGTVDKAGVRHAQLRCPLVHPLYKGLLAAGQMFRQRYGGVVAGGHRHGLQQIMDGHLLPFL